MSAVRRWGIIIDINTQVRYNRIPRELKVLSCINCLRNVVVSWKCYEKHVTYVRPRENREKSCGGVISRCGGHGMRISCSGEHSRKVKREENDGVYSPAAVISHHQQQQAATSARAPAISAAAHDTRALAGRPGGLSAARSMLARASRTRTLPTPEVRPTPRAPLPRYIFRVSLESARAALFSGGSLTAPNWLGPFTCRTRFRSVQPQSLCAQLLRWSCMCRQLRVNNLLHSVHQAKVYIFYYSVVAKNILLHNFIQTIKFERKLSTAFAWTSKKKFPPMYYV